MLRIEDIDNGEEELDENIGQTAFSPNEDSPKNLEDHITDNSQNMEHFIAMLKRYGVSRSMVSVPSTANSEQFASVETPEASLKSMSATHKDKDLFIQFLVE